MNQIINYQEYPKENREHKSTLFCKVFEEKKYLLDLYNSVNGTAYQNEEDLEVNTLENVVYMSMKNDASFLIDCNMCLYEHQSTYNPNMPLRGLLYFAQLYNKYIAIQKDNIRQYVGGCLECEARMLNINYGHNRNLLEKCRRLEEYAIFVSRVRQYTAEEPENPKRAITRAVDDCIQEGILEDVLKSQKAEVLELVLTTFNKELYEKGLREDAAREALEEAVGPARKEGENKLGKLVSALLDDGLTDIIRLVSLDETAREEYYKKYGIE